MKQSRKTDPAYLHGIGTAVPDSWYSQDYILDFFRNLEGTGRKQKKFLGKIYSGSGIDKRHTVVDDYGKDPSQYAFFPPNKGLKPEPTTKKRNDLFIAEADKLSFRAVQNAFEKTSGIGPMDVTHLITVSCTGFSAPGFDLHLIRDIPLPPHTRRYHLGFMGCYAALTALDLAKNICNAEPSAKVLMVNVELCTLHFQRKEDLDTLVANAIFADGASAALITPDENDSKGNTLSLEAFRSQFVEGSEEEMAWSIGDTGFDMKLSAYVPRIINENVQDTLMNILSKAGYSREDIDIWAVHPGGKAILEKIEGSLGLEGGELDYSYHILREYGNMSSVTIMYVLDRILSDEKEGNVLAMAFGPGLTVETGFLKKRLAAR